MTPKPYRWADQATGFLLLVAVVFAPWAFGATQGWSIWTLNGIGYGMGGLLAFKGLVRWKVDFEPARWNDGIGRKWPVRALAILTVVVLGYVLVSALNARAKIDYTYLPGQAVATGIDIEYLEPVGWLPSSYDGATTLWAFWKYLAMACAFWSARDWVLGMSRRERRLSTVERIQGAVPSDRLARLLWTLVLSTAALSLVGILQRLEGTRKLLWILEHTNRSEVTFGPFPYRGTASDYLNLVWPIGIAFWWALRRRFLWVQGAAARSGSGPHVVILPLLGIILIGPFMTSSRGGLFIEIVLLAVSALVLWFSGRLKSAAKWSLVGVTILLMSVGWYLGGAQLAQRFATMGDDKMSGREDLYANGPRMVADFAPFGSGAETFPKIYTLYRANPNQRWEAYAHDDYLETRITFGWVGMGLILSALLLVPLCGQLSSGIPTGRTFHLLWITALGGLMLHARFDPPFQIYSIHFTFVILCAVWSCLTPVKE